MVTLESFLENQEKIYNKFRNTSKVKTEGLLPDPNLTEERGGYFILLKHPREINESLEEFAKKVSSIVPAIAYDASKLHTTIATYKIRKNFQPENEILDKLNECIFLSSPLDNIVINYKEILFNQTSVIATGYPEYSFLQFFFDQIKVHAEKRSIDLTPPSMAHITLNRFSKNVPPEQLKEFFDLFKYLPKIGQSIPNCIEVGYFQSTPNNFIQKVYERFYL